VTRTVAFNQLLADVAPDIEAVVRRYADDPMDADDLRQEIAIAIWRAMPRFEGRASARTYVLRIAHNRASTFCLQRARNRALFSAISTGDHPVSPSITAEHEGARLVERLHDAMARLPDGQREVLALAVAGNLPAEIARRTGRNAGAVRVALHRARTAVRTWLGLEAEDR